MEIEFEEWMSSLNSERKEKIAPTSPGLKPGGPAHKAMLKNYFIESVWPEIENSF